MHIAVVTKNMGAGGAERVISQLLKEWTKSGVSCTLICMHPGDVFYSVCEGVERYDVPKFSENYNVDKLLRYRHLRKVIRKMSPDIVLSLPEEIGIYVLGALIGTGIPVVVSERNDPWQMPNKKITRILRKLMYPFAKGIVFQTEQATEFFSPAIRKKGIVLPNPLDLTRIPQPHEGERKKVIIGAGRLVPQKNFRLLIDAFSDFYENHRDYKLIIYGEGYLRDELEEYARKLPHGVISFPGVSEHLLEEIKSASMFVLSSDYEGLPNVLIEAMAMGMPVAATDCRPGGAASLIDHGKNGMLVPMGDACRLSGAMKKLANDLDFANSVGKNALRIRECLNSEDVSKAWMEYLNSRLLV